MNEELRIKNYEFRELLLHSKILSCALKNLIDLSISYKGKQDVKLFIPLPATLNNFEVHPTNAVCSRLSFRLSIFVYSPMQVV